jgi:hypothetical protein
VVGVEDDPEEDIGDDCGVAELNRQCPDRADTNIAPLSKLFRSVFWSPNKQLRWSHNMDLCDCNDVHASVDDRKCSVDRARNNIRRHFGICAKIGVKELSILRKQSDVYQATVGQLAR